MSAPACVLGFDVGARRIGVAIGNPVSDSARDLEVVGMLADGPDWARIDRLVKDWRPAALVVGEPLRLDGGDQPARQRARGFARALRRRYALPVELVDERSTSVEAARQFARERAGGARRRRDAERLDAMAAALILRRWMDHGGAPGSVPDASTRDDPEVST